MADTIHIADLELSTHIGVPEEERAVPQRLTLNLTLRPRRDFRALDDLIKNTVDYFTLSKAVQALAREKPRCLIETLADEIATLVLSRFAVQEVEVELRKYILPDTTYVAVRLSRTAG